MKTDALRNPSEDSKHTGPKPLPLLHCHLVVQCHKFIPVQSNKVNVSILFLHHVSGIMSVTVQLEEFTYRNAFYLCV